MKSRKKKTKKRWVQFALASGHKGALHRALRIPEGQKIPLAKLKAAAKKPGKVGRMARLAETLRNLKK